MNAAVFSYSGQNVISASQDRTVRIWDLKKAAIRDTIMTSSTTVDVINGATEYA